MGFRIQIERQGKVIKVPVSLGDNSPTLYYYRKHWCLSVGTAGADLKKGYMLCRSLSEFPTLISRDELRYLKAHGHLSQVEPEEWFLNDAGN